VDPPSWVEVIYLIPLYGVSRGLNLNLSSVGGRCVKLTDYYRAEARRYLPDRAKTEARPCEAEPAKKLPRGGLERRQMPRGLHPCKLPAVSLGYHADGRVPRRYTADGS